MSEASYWLIRFENQVLVRFEAGENVFPFGSAADFGHPENPLLIGQWNGRNCYAADFHALPESIGGELMPVRSLFGAAGEEAFFLAGRGTQ